MIYRAGWWLSNATADGIVFISSPGLQRAALLAERVDPLRPIGDPATQAKKARLLRSPWAARLPFLAMNASGHFGVLL